MRRRLASGLLVLPAMLALAAGCGKPSGGEGVATAGGGAGAQGSASPAAAEVSDADRQLKFAQCMRENGVEMPDPEPGEAGKGFRINLGGDVSPEKAKAAMEKCRSYMPNGGQPPKLDPEQVEKMRKYAQCMRDNGVPGFPDPQPDGTMQLDTRQLGDIKPDNPTFQAANEKCKQFSPKAGGFTFEGKGK
ncbi:hypothetical protein AB0J86_27720 [Micromonospora sp. NPDC049559]|uniref:hypothetical protein n=1 Tax=Micromonospora sp. NPDC049559 TaxID=3155923 RepID=UPI003437EDA6